MRKLILLFLPFFFVACTDEIELDLGQKEKPAVVVEAFLTDSAQMSQWIRLTKTTSYYNTDRVPAVEGADVTVQGNGNLYAFQQNADPDSSSYYMAPSGFDLQNGNSYELEIDHQDSSYRASSTVRPVPRIDSIHLRLNPFQSASGQDIQDTTLQVIAHFDDFPQPGDHYLFNLHIGGELYSEKANEKTVVDDGGWQGGGVELAAQSFSKSDVDLGDTLTLTIRSVSAACDEFYAIFNDQTELSGNPFAAAPPANIPTNMSGTALGFYQVSSIRKHSRVVDAQLLSNIEVLGGP